MRASGPPAVVVIGDVVRLRELLTAPLPTDPVLADTVLADTVLADPVLADRRCLLTASLPQLVACEVELGGPTA